MKKVLLLKICSCTGLKICSGYELTDDWKPESMYEEKEHIKELSPPVFEWIKIMK